MLKFSDLIVNAAESLRSAMQRMTRNRRGILFVCDEDSHLIGVLSDGDVRRSLLDDTLLVAPVEKVMNTDPVTARTADEAAQLLHRHALVAVPVVDVEGRIEEAVVEDQGGVLVLRQQESLDLAAEVRKKTGALSIIPARGGSKRIPKKNLALVGGKTLLAWAVQAATTAQRVSHVIVSTDDPQIAEAARSQGADVPWLRPEPLSRDDTPTLDVLLHAVNWAVGNLSPAPDFAVLLEPTAPLRKAEHIDEAIEILERSDADCVASVSLIPHIFHPEELLLIEQGQLRPYLPSRTMDTRHLRGRQSPVYVLNGLVYAFRTASLLTKQSLFGQKTLPLVTDWEDFVDIDTPTDLQVAGLKVEAKAFESGVRSY